MKYFRGQITIINLIGLLLAMIFYIIVIVPITSKLITSVYADYPNIDDLTKTIVSILPGLVGIALILTIYRLIIPRPDYIG